MILTVYECVFVPNDKRRKLVFNVHLMLGFCAEEWSWCWVWGWLHKARLYVHS